MFNGWVTTSRQKECDVYNSVYIDEDKTSYDNIKYEHSSYHFYTLETKIL